MVASITRAFLEFTSNIFMYIVDDYLPPSHWIRSDETRPISLLEMNNLTLLFNLNGRFFNPDKAYHSLNLLEIIPLLEGPAAETPFQSTTPCQQPSLN